MKNSINDVSDTLCTNRPYHEKKIHYRIWKKMMPIYIENLKLRGLSIKLKFWLRDVQKMQFWFGKETICLERPQQQVVSQMLFISHFKWWRWNMHHTKEKCLWVIAYQFGVAKWQKKKFNYKVCEILKIALVFGLQKIQNS